MLDMLDTVSAFDVEIRLSVFDQDLPSSPAWSRRWITLKGFHCCGYRNGISGAFRGGFPRKVLFIQRRWPTVKVTASLTALLLSLKAPAAIRDFPKAARYL